MANLKRKMEFDLDENIEEWDKLEIDYRAGKATFKKFRNKHYPTEQEVVQLCRKVPQNCRRSLKRLLNKNENNKGILTPLKAYNIVSAILELNQKRGFSWNKIRGAIEKTLDRKISDIRYVVGILRNERKRELEEEEEQ